MRPLENLGAVRKALTRRIHPHFVGLSLTEFWERFALAGVKSMLTLLLIDHVSPPTADMIGMAWLQEQLSGVGSREAVAVALASYLYGVASALVYLSIPLGGLIGDLLIGRRASVLAGGAGMVAGLLLMISLQGFLPGLLLFAAGAGLLKGNLSAQFGSLFAEEAQRRRAYSYYLVFLNAGVVFGALAMGTAALVFGWRYAFGLAAGGVSAGLATYMILLGGTAERPPAARRASTAESQAEGAQKAGPSVFMRLSLVLLAVYFCFAAYGQIGNIVLVWAKQTVDLDFGFGALPVGWVLALDGLFTILLIFVMQAALGFARRRGVVVGPYMQIILGCLACAAGYFVLILAEWTGAATFSPAWLLAYLLLVDLAIVLVWPSGLSLVTDLAPQGRVGLWGGLFYLHGFFASLWVGFAGGYFQTLGMASFWLIHLVVALSGAALAFVAALLARRSRARYQATTTSA